MNGIGDTEMLSGSDYRGTLMMSGDPPDGGLTEVKSVLGNTRLVCGKTHWDRE